MKKYRSNDTKALAYMTTQLLKFKLAKTQDPEALEDNTVGIENEYRRMLDKSTQKGRCSENGRHSLCGRDSI